MHHPLADGQVADARADPLDDPGGLVAEQHRHRPHPVAVDHRQVGVADARRLDADQNFVAARAARGRGRRW